MANADNSFFPDLDFRLLFESAPGLYLVLNPDLVIAGASNAYLNATMTTREKIIGHGLFEIFPDNPADLEATGVSNLGRSLQRVLAEKVADTMAVQKYDVRRPQSEGGEFEERYWSPTNSPVFGPDGQIVYIIHRVEDVTEYIRQKQLEGKQTQLHEELKTRAETMAAEIYSRAQELQAFNKQLQTLNKELQNEVRARQEAEKEIRLLNQELQDHAARIEASNSDLESFSYSVSHDLRTPLRAINGYALMLKEESEQHLDDEGVRYLSLIVSNSQRMAMLIDDLLRFSKLGRQAVEKQALDMAQLVQEAIQEALDASAGCVPEIRLAPLPQAMADRVLMRQVWVNLIANAIKYSSKASKPLIEISGTLADDEAIYSVRDNGAGFDMAYYEKLFGVFQRLHRADEFNGTGVGLAIVQRAVARHGGRVWAEGKVNAGAEFSFALPLGKENG